MNRHQIIIKVLTIVFTLSLAACNGSGDADSTILSGIAAAGAPVIGEVTVKDSLDNTRSVTIEANGNYNIDVNGMMPPFRLRAEGTVAGRTYRLYSYAEAADLGGTVNITPFTELIIANAAKQIAELYFESNSPVALSAAQLDEQEAALKLKLQEVFNALGVNAAVSLLYDAFSTDHTGLDAILDLVRIEANSDTNSYTIQNYIEGTSITDDVANPTDSSILQVLDPAALSGVVTHLGCANESGWDSAANNGLGAPITPYSFEEYETVVKDCGALDLSMIGVAGSVFNKGTETITLNNTGKAATVNDPESGSFNDSNIKFQWYVEQASCDGCFHSYIVIFTDQSIDASLPQGYWYRQTAALIGISGTNSDYYSFVKYNEQSNYSNINRLSGSDGEIRNETQILN